MLVEGEFFVVGNHDDAEVFLVYFMDLVDEDFADALALVFGAYEQVMYVGIHDTIVHGADHADKLIAVPGRNDGLEVLHCDYKLVGEMPRRPFDGEKKVL